MIIVPTIQMRDKHGTDFRYLLPYKDEVSIRIFDHHGNEMDTVLNCVQEAGEYSIRYDTSQLPAGKYFYMIKTHQDTVVRLLQVDAEKQD